MVLPRCDTQAMSLHLAEVAQAVAPGAHGVMLMDRAGWHCAQDPEAAEAFKKVSRSAWRKLGARIPASA